MRVYISMAFLEIMEVVVMYAVDSVGGGNRCMLSILLCS